MTEQEEIYNSIYSENYEVDEIAPNRQSSFNWEDYERKLSIRPKLKTNTYMGEILDSYLQYLKWDDQTFNEDMTALMVAANFYWKRHLPAEFRKILEWVKVKNSLHPRQLSKLFYKVKK